MANFVVSITNLFDKVILSLKTDIKYYEQQATKFKYASGIVVALAILAFIVGTLAPVLNGVGIDKISKYDMLSVGYLALAIAAALLVVDRYALLTENNVSKIVTQVALTALLKRLELEKDLGIRILVLIRGTPCQRERQGKCSTVWIRPSWGSRVEGRRGCRNTRFSTCRRCRRRDKRSDGLIGRVAFPSLIAARPSRLSGGLSRINVADPAPAHPAKAGPGQLAPWP